MSEQPNIPINIRRRYHLIGIILYDLLQHIYPCEYNSSDHFVEGVIDELFYYIGNQPEFNGLDLMTVNDFILEHKYDELTDYFNEHCIVLKNDYLQEHIRRIREMMGMDDSRLTFDIQKLVDDGIIFVTEPGDGQGGVAKPNWEGDCSVITLPNLTDEQLELNPWRKEAINRPFIECIPYVQDRQSDWSEEKYQQVIDSIEMKGGEIDNYTI